MKKSFSVFICAVYGFILLYFGAALFLLPQKSFSYTENRVLTPLPTISAESVLDKSFFSRLDSYTKDQFPHRNAFLKINGIFDLSMGRLESGGVMMGKDGCLIKRLEYSDFTVAADETAKIKEVLGTAKARGIPAYFVCPPRAIDVLEGHCPYFFDGTDSGNLAYKEVGIGDDSAFLKKILKAKADSGEYVYYKTDHHWTSLGAYYAYWELGKLLGYTPYEKEDFREEILTESFLGTSYSSSLLPTKDGDRITAFRYDEDKDIIITDMLTGESKPLYFKDKLLTPSKYDVFLGGNHGYLEISSKEDAPHLIVIKDSFANSLVPFLARHYNISLLDPRYIKTDFYAILDKIMEKTDSQLLVLINIDTIFTGTGL